MHEIALVIIEKIKANLSMSGTFGESIFQSKLPPQANRRPRFQRKSLLLLNALLDFGCVLMQE